MMEFHHRAFFICLQILYGVTISCRKASNCFIITTISFYVGKASPGLFISYVFAGFADSAAPADPATPSIPAGHSVPAGQYACDPVQIGHTQQKHTFINVSLHLSKHIPSFSNFSTSSPPSCKLWAVGPLKSI